MDEWIGSPVERAGHMVEDATHFCHARLTRLASGVEQTRFVICQSSDMVVCLVAWTGKYVFVKHFTDYISTMLPYQPI